MISVEAKNHGHVRDIINWCTEALTDNQEPQGLDRSMVSTEVVLIADYWRPGWRAGGPIVSLGRLGDHTRARTWVVTRDHDRGSSDPYPGVTPNAWTLEGPRHNHTAYLRGMRTPWWMLREIRRIKPDIVHINSVHSPVYGILPLLAIKLRLLPRSHVLVTPHGELTQASQAHKHWKKALAAPVLRSLTNSGITWHAASDAELADIQRWTRKGQVPVVVSADPAPPPAMRASEGPTTPTILFASRIHPIKGLREAIEILATIATPCTFVIAGHVEDDQYWQSCLTKLRDLPNHITVQIHGPYTPSHITVLLAHATVMLLPTRGENFGQVIAESLSQGCPVAIPPTTPWGEYVGNAAGCITDNPEVTLDFLQLTLSEGTAARRQRRAAVRMAYEDWYAQRGHDDLYSKAAFEMSWSS